jgi:pyridoxal phosphate enzyme (YggS family)
VQGEIEDAARAADRDPASVTTIVVTKFHPASLVRELAALGVRDFGESRHQEAQAKVAELADLDATWHFVGQLQSKKARQVRAYADVLHSVDRIALVDALGAREDAGHDDLSRDVFVQVNLTDNLQRGGVLPAELDALVERVAASADLRLIGLMMIAPLGGDPRAAFAALRTLSERVRATVPTASGLSMGMSGDFREAILEGATHLRIGTAITGNRPEHG